MLLRVYHLFSYNKNNNSLSLLQRYVGLGVFLGPNVQHLDTHSFGRSLP